MSDKNQFVPVPGRTLPGGQVVAPFLIGKYLAAIDADGQVTVTEEAVPTVRINFNKARDTLAAAGLPMLTLSQSAALALDVAGVAENWSGGKVGEGKLMQGLHRGTVNGAVSGLCVSKDETERRGFKLSNGETVYDVAGHLYAWLFDDVHGDEHGVVKTDSLPSDSPAVIAPYPAGEHGIGYPFDAGNDLSGRALVRGGFWFSRDDAGVFALSSDWPGDGDSSVGVRCTKPGP